MSIFLRFKKVRTIEGLTQSQYASALGIDQSDVSNYERAIAKEIPSAIMEKLNTLYDIDINWFVTGKGEAKLVGYEQKSPIKYIEDWVIETDIRINNLEEICGVKTDGKKIGNQLVIPKEDYGAKAHPLKVKPRH